MVTANLAVGEVLILFSTELLTQWKVTAALFLHRIYLVLNCTWYPTMLWIMVDTDLKMTFVPEVSSSTQTGLYPGKGKQRRIFTASCWWQFRESRASVVWLSWYSVCVCSDLGQKGPLKVSDPTSHLQQTVASIGSS